MLLKLYGLLSFKHWMQICLCVSIGCKPNIHYSSGRRLCRYLDRPCDAERRPCHGRWLVHSSIGPGQRSVCVYGTPWRKIQLFSIIQGNGAMHTQMLKHTVLKHTNVRCSRERDETLKIVEYLIRPRNNTLLL